MSDQTTATKEKEFAKRDPHIRRIVTGHDASGKSVIAMDGYATNHKYPNERMISSLLWCTDSAPATWDTKEDMGARILGTAPPPNGTRFMHSDLAPGEVEHGWPHMHRTDSIDYKIIISGEVTMYLDDTKTVCKAGDVIIGMGTNHAWVNEGTVPCRSVTVLVDANPKRTDSVSGATTQKH
jgi:mannose-6-phosphate isomerase-like protein (cupin superfamily)